MRILLIFIATLVLQIILRGLIGQVVRRIVSRHRFESKSDELKREETLITVLRTGIGVLLWLVAVLAILEIMGVNVAAAATGAGVFGIVLGIGAQSTIKDFLAGLFILFGNQYRVGDIVTLSGGTTGVVGASGVVEEVTLWITKLRGLDGTLSIIRNGEASIISNMSFTFSSVVIDVSVVYESDIDIIETVMNEVGLQIAGEEKWRKLVVQPITFLRVDAFTPSGVTVRAVGRVAPASQWDIAGAYRRELLKAFAKSGVDIALPQITVRQPPAHKTTKSLR